MTKFFEMNSKINYAVVEITENNKNFASVVSESWIFESRKKCYWPVGPSTYQCLVNHAKPDSSWLIYNCKILKISRK